MDETRTWLRPAATVLALGSIALVLVNAALVVRNQGAQAVVNQRQQAINQAAQLSRIGQVLLQASARSAVVNKDDALTALLERHGVRINVNPSAPAVPEKQP